MGAHEIIAEMKDYNVIIDGRIFFNQLLRNNIETYENIENV